MLLVPLSISPKEFLGGEGKQQQFFKSINYEIDLKMCECFTYCREGFALGGVCVENRYREVVPGHYMPDEYGLYA